jgi:hydroxymethylpyrimidine/phosphomethylpyrimidine kinase
MASPPPIVLTIAGFDPSSGAGVTADIKTLAAHGCYGVACITALTVQSTQGVKAVAPVPANLVAETLAELAGDLSPAAIRVGMLGSAGVAQEVAGFLKTQSCPLVLDPVLRSSSGAELLDAEGVAVLSTQLLPLATVITPNLAEAAALTGLEVGSLEQMKAAAARLHDAGARNVVITGGHLAAPVDLLSEGGRLTEFPGERIESRSTHGTGCAFATALAANLARGRSLAESVARAQAYVRAAIAAAYSLGRGTGPINHLHRKQEP